ncbi:C2H2-type zinc finger protein [archaeon]|nr:MAG: C2H2-type zinc finger protein [archaeon]
MDDSKAAEAEGEGEQEHSADTFHCAVCSKYFKTEAQLNQHVASKVHRKKATEAQRKVKSK